MGSKKMICGKCHKKWIPNYSDDYYTVDGIEMCEGCAMPYLFKTRDLEQVSDEHRKKFCRPGQETACAFIGASPEFMCTKCTPAENTLREKLEKGLLRARGDNCSGPPAFDIIIVA